MLAQFIGGMAAMGLSWMGTFDIPDDNIAKIAPTNPMTGDPDNGDSADDFQMYFAVLLNEIVCTFLFVSVILMVKGEHTAGDRKGVCAALCVVSTLLCVISGTNKLGAAFNPAVGTAVTTYSVLRLEHEDGQSNEWLYHYLWCYTVGPYIGGLCAGLFHLIHKGFHEPEEPYKSQGFSEEQTQRLTAD